MKTVKCFVWVAILILCAGCTGPAVMGQATAYAADILSPGQELRIGDYLRSADGKYRLILQRDGNLVLYGPRRDPIWSSETQGIPVVRCVMQTDGNLVLYTPDSQSAWNSGTQQRPGSFLWLQNDGNLVIYQPVWGVSNEQRRRMEEHHDRRDHDREEDRWRR